MTGEHLSPNVVIRPRKGEINLEVSPLISSQDMDRT
jgi:hypothetical protein